MLAIMMIIGGVLLRLLPHMPNFAPIAATALFGGVYLNKRFAILVPLVAMAVSDYLLLYIHPFQYPMADFSHIYPLTAMFHASTVFVWGSFIISGFIGMQIKKHKSIQNVLVGSLLSSVLFFLITNFGFWLGNDLYPKTFNGQIEAYVMAVSFFKWTLLGDLFYTGVFFGAYELAIKVTHRTRVALA
ncbi:MAG: DUF6580 family putative transport protein [Candidatus Levyibacteriota bacterium]